MLQKLINERLGLPVPQRNMWGQDGRQYGDEWSRDGFDRWIDIYLWNKYKAGPAVSEKVVMPRALDIGCGTGRRIEELLALGIFGQIFANDTKIQRDFRFAADGYSKAPLKNPAGFVEKNILELKPWDFEGLPFDYINCRNVLHFLAPQDCRKAIKIIGMLAAEGALVTLSFSSHDRSSTLVSIEEDNPKFYSDMAWDEDAPAPMAIYIKQSVEAFMRRVGLNCCPTQRILIRTAFVKMSAILLHSHPAELD